MERMARIALLASVTVGSTSSYWALCLIDSSVSRWRLASRPKSPASFTSASDCWWSSPAAWRPRPRQQIESAAAIPARTALLTAADLSVPRRIPDPVRRDRRRPWPGRIAGPRPEDRRAEFVTTSWPSASQSSNQVDSLGFEGGVELWGSLREAVEFLCGVVQEVAWVPGQLVDPNRDVLLSALL